MNKLIRKIKEVKDKIYGPVVTIKMTVEEFKEWQKESPKSGYGACPYCEGSTSNICNHD